MAKKSRVPPPPRRPGQRPVQAPKPRTRKGEPLDLARARRRRNALLGLAVTGVVALAVVLVLQSRTGGGGGADDAGVATKLAAAGCTYSTFPDQGRHHVQSLDAKVAYNSFPPTSGPHCTVAWSSSTGPGSRPPPVRPQ